MDALIVSMWVTNKHTMVLAALVRNTDAMTRRSFPQPAPSHLLVTIRAQLPALRPAEVRVATAVLDDPAGVSGTSITTLARECQTSETTVVRFCRAVGVEGYAALRMALARECSRAEVNAGAPVLSGDISAEDALEDVIAKIGSADVRAIEDTMTNLDVASLEVAVTRVSEARRIDVVGIGASGFVAADLAQKLHRIGRTAIAWIDPHAALTSAALLGTDDVIIGISHTGSTIETVEPLDVASAAGCFTIAITNTLGSPLAKVADVMLATVARETTFRSGAMASRIAQLSLVDCLFVGVAQRSYDETMTALELTYAAVHHRRRGR